MVSHRRRSARWTSLTRKLRKTARPTPGAFRHQLEVRPRLQTILRQYCLRLETGKMKSTQTRSARRLTQARGISPSPIRPDTEPKQGKPDKELPGARTMAGNAIKAAGELIRNGFKPASEEEQSRRLKICKECEHYLKDQNRCSQCGCFLKWKSRMRAWSCPVGRW